MADNDDSGGPNGGPRGRLTWTNVIALAALALTLLGGGYVLTQTELNHAKEIASKDARIAELANKNLNDLVSIDRMQYSANFNRVEKDVETLASELKARIIDIHGELRQDFPTRHEFKQFEERFIALKQAVDTLTADQKPTNAELSHLIDGLLQAHTELAKSVFDISTKSAHDPTPKTFPPN